MPLLEVEVENKGFEVQKELEEEEEVGFIWAVAQKEVWLLEVVVEDEEVFEKRGLIWEVVLVVFEEELLEKDIVGLVCCVVD